MRLLCISASNSFREGITETSSFMICQRIIHEAKRKVPQADCSVIELKYRAPNPCIDCAKCLSSRRCAIDDVFNEIYEEIIACDGLFIVSPHYAPIPAKLCMILEKMESISFNPWQKDNDHKSEVYGIPTGIISYGGTGEEWALRDYARVVNIPIANALHTIQLKVVPYNDEWKKGISVPPVAENQDSSLEDYVGKVIKILTEVS